MQLLDIITWEPKDTEMVMTLFENYDYPQGIKVIDEWIDFTGYRMFIIYETEGEKIFAPSISPFIGLCRFETVPVMKADIYTEMAQENAEKTDKRKYGAEHGKDISEKELNKQMENLEKRVQHLEHHSFIQKEDVT